MGSPRKIELMTAIDALVERANVNPARREKSNHDQLIALRHQGRIYVRNVCRDPDGIVVASFAHVFYPLIGQRIPHRTSGVRLDRILKAGIRIHRMPFRVDRPMPNVAADTTEADFDRWWLRTFYPGADIAGLMKKRQLTPRERLIRDYYKTQGNRWTPFRMRMLARSLGTDIETFCAAIRLPLYVFGWYEETYQASSGSSFARCVDVMGPAFLLCDFLKASKAGVTGSVLFPFSGLRDAPATTTASTSRAA